jgi:hypothetical protein
MPRATAGAAGRRKSPSLPHGGRRGHALKAAGFRRDVHFALLDDASLLRDSGNMCQRGSARDGRSSNEAVVGASRNFAAPSGGPSGRKTTALRRRAEIRRSAFAPSRTSSIASASHVVAARYGCAIAPSSFFASRSHIHFPARRRPGGRRGWRATRSRRLHPVANVLKCSLFLRSFFSAGAARARRYLSIRSLAFALEVVRLRMMDCEGASKSREVLWRCRRRSSLTDHGPTAIRSIAE